MAYRSACPTCRGTACEHNCGVCEYADVGPDSHKVCRDCGGTGRVKVYDAPDMDEQRELDPAEPDAPEYDVREDEAVELDRAERQYGKWITGDIHG